VPRKTQLSLQWVSNLSPSEAEEFKKSLFGSKKVLDKLLEICYNKSKVVESPKLTDYDSPSWSHKQAHMNGRLEALQEIIQLITLPDQG
jgi:hypothetical protein